jgi:hypothetical protein
MKLAQDFDALVATYKQLLQACADALAPGKTQEERNRMRDAITKYLKSGDKQG